MKLSYREALAAASAGGRSRLFPASDDARCRGGVLYPKVAPKFRLGFGPDVTVFTIGSCFARNIESGLSKLGVRLPTRRLVDPEAERGRPSSILNEYNPATMRHRIIKALAGQPDDPATLVDTSDGCADLLLHRVAEIPRERAEARRHRIFEIYAELAASQLVVLTLGLVECWYDNLAGCFINRLPPRSVAEADPARFSFRRLEVAEIVTLLEEPLEALGAHGIKVVLTVSPVPLRATFTGEDCVVANEFSKSALRLAADALCRRFGHVAYFPSYEIVRSGGLACFEADNVHVRNDLVHDITRSMVESFNAALHARGGIQADSASRQT